MNSWNRNWETAAKNIFEALQLIKGDRLVILYNPLPIGKEHLVNALTKLAQQKEIPAKAIALTLDEDFKTDPLETELVTFLEGTNKNQRKFFFTAAKSHFGPARRAVHKLVSIDPQKLYGYTISLPTDDADIITALAGASPNQLWSRGEELANTLSKATIIRITTKKGTDVSFSWDAQRRKYLISAGFPHTHEDRWDNMGGEVFTAPLHQTVNGKLVIDGAIANIGLVDGTIVVDITNGKGKINRTESTASEKMLKEFEADLTIYPCACIVGEFGIGTTPNLKLRGELLHDEKVEGTIHLAFGDSYASDGSGGENDCDAHSDCMILEPTVDMTIEGKTKRLMENGIFV
jgi:leucyl aminopeptidase (aminopeptidase T)